MRPSLPSQPQLLTIADRSPPVHISDVRLLGRLKVEGGELSLIRCLIEELKQDGGGGQRRLGAVAQERALVVRSGGRVSLTQVVMQGLSAGAISVHTASLRLEACRFRDCHAQSGGVMLVEPDSHVTVKQSAFSDSSAATSGGAMVVTRGSNVSIVDSSFVGNSAVVSGGALQVHSWPTSTPLHSLLVAAHATNCVVARSSGSLTPPGVR
eukprot:2334965-Prymnesium_polylepis.1